MRTSAVRSEVREVMDIRQAAAYLGISADSLYKYASEGFIPAFKLGNRWRFKKSRIDEWMDQQSSASLMPVEPIAVVAAREKKPVRAAR
jgi:excisionase family DNA binding protein